MNKKRLDPKRDYILVISFTLILLFFGFTVSAQWDFSSDYFKIHLDQKGFITSMRNITVIPNREYSSCDKKSPLLSLYNTDKNEYYEPVKAKFTKTNGTISLTFSNGSEARVLLNLKPKYFKFTLQSLSPRNGVDDIQWGSYHTKINNLFGEIIGVARDTSDINNYAIGILALNDITTGGTSNIQGDAAPFQYIIHTPDKVKFPLPTNLKEGQVFPIGGDGISDVAFYSHHEPYYRILYGNAAFADNDGEIFLTYHSRDRRKKREILFSLIPFLPTDVPNHQEVQPLPGVDFIGSSIAMWGSPDSTALCDVIQNIVLSEGLPYPQINWKWVKDPARYIPDAFTKGSLYDSTLTYMAQLGFKAVELEDLPYFKVDRGNKGFIDGKHFELKPFHFTSGDKSHKEFTAQTNQKGILLGRHTITTALAPGTMDASPIPNDSLCYQLKRLLIKDIDASDTIIEVNDPTYLDEIASWEGHCESLNMIKIGKEIIHYVGVSKTKPYNLQKVKRGYWQTRATSHLANDPIFKLQVTINYGYDGIIPDIFLQDEIAKYFADVSSINGIGFMDLDGEEFLFDSGHGYYSVKRFFRKMFERASMHQIPYLRISGATLSEGSWHYQSVWNVGGGTNMYDLKTRQWGSTTSEGKDIRDVAYSNYFPATFGGNFGINSTSTPDEYNHVEAISVGVGATYIMELNQKSIESCPNKYEIFKTIRTWENARAANAFSRGIKKQLSNPANNWSLIEVDKDTWKLFNRINGVNTNPVLLKRAKGY